MHGGQTSKKTLHLTTWTQALLALLETQAFAWNTRASVQMWSSCHTRAPLLYPPKTLSSMAPSSLAA